MTNKMETIATEDNLLIPFFNKIPLSIERGEGVAVWDEKGKKYIDFTAGWGVTCLGHAHPVIVEALSEQCRKIIQNPSSGLTYSPARAKLLSLMGEVLPKNLGRVFFTNSGAESNDAVIKLARKISGRDQVVSSNKSFHGRTISTASATGQSKHRKKFNPLMPGYSFVPYNDIPAMEKVLSDQVAAVILEPIQGEGGVNIPADDYLKRVSDLCRKNGSYLIIDEVQTGFCRTGPMFAIENLNIKTDFLTLAKGIAGGFPFGAFAISEEVAEKIEIGDHGGTYCGNPLGCAVSHAVIKYIRENNIQNNVNTVGLYIIDRLKKIQLRFPDLIAEVRGRGLLIALAFFDQTKANNVYHECIDRGLLVNLTQGNIIRLLPALNITINEAQEGVDLLEKAINFLPGQGI